MGRHRVHGNLYQLVLRTQSPGTIVKINGPYDKWGYVVSIKEEREKGESLHLIRGTGNTPAKPKKLSDGRMVLIPDY